MSDYQERMREESNQLKGRIARGQDYLARHPDDRLLAAQLSVMGAYEDILGERMEQAAA